VNQEKDEGGRIKDEEIGREKKRFIHR